MPDPIKDLLAAPKGKTKAQALDQHNAEVLSIATAHGAKTIKTQAGGLSVDPASRKGTKKGGGKKVGSRMLRFTCSCPEPFIVRCAKVELYALCLTCDAPFRLDEASIPESSTLKGAKGQYPSRADALEAMRKEGLLKADPLAPLKGEDIIKALKKAIKKVRAEMRADDSEPDPPRDNPDDPTYDPSDPAQRVRVTQKSAPQKDPNYDPQEPPSWSLEAEHEEEHRKAVQRKERSDARKAKKVAAEVEKLARRSAFFGQEITAQEVEAIKAKVSTPRRNMTAKRAAKIDQRMAKKKKPTGRDLAKLRKVETYHEFKAKRTERKAKKVAR